MSKHLRGKADIVQRKRELRLRIGRSRRRIDGRLFAMETHARQLISWRTYFSRSGLRWAESLGPNVLALLNSPTAKTSQKLGWRLLRKAFRYVRRSVWTGLKWLWKQTQPQQPVASQRPAKTKGAAHGRA